MQVRPSGPQPARVLIVGEAPGEKEVEFGRPFVGYSGTLLTQWLSEAGIDQRTCRITNVTMERPPSNDIDLFYGSRKNPQGCEFIGGRYCKAPIANGLRELCREIDATKPDLIIALGGTALWALTGEPSVEKWRGSIIKHDHRAPCRLAFGPVPEPTRSIPLISTYHPAGVLRQWSWRFIAQADIRRAAAALIKFPVGPQTSFLLRPSAQLCLEYLHKLLARLAEGPVRISNDIETIARHISVSGFSYDPSEALVIPFMGEHGATRYFSESEEFEVTMAVREVLMHPNARVVGQNFLYDAQYYIRQMFCWPRLAEDTMVMQHVCFVEMPKDLGFLSSMYLPDHIYWKDELKDYNSMPVDVMKYWLYNGKDVINTLRIATELRNTVAKMGLMPQFLFQMEVCNALLEMMWRGAKIDLSRKREITTLLREQKSHLSESLEYLAGRNCGVVSKGCSPWYTSPKQTASLLYDEFKLKEITKRKTGKRTTDDEALEKIAASNTLLRPLIRPLQQLRSTGVLLSTFAEMSLDSDLRVRCSYNIGGTVTYRLSSSENAFGNGGNLQNIPRLEEGRTDETQIRGMFVPDEGYTLLDFDLGSADLRVVAWEADDVELKSIIKAGQDVYTIIAREYFRDPSIVKKDHRRQTFKGVAHAIDYGAKDAALAANFGLLVVDAARIRKWYLERFPGIKKWQERIESDLNTKHRITNIFGFQRIFLDRVETMLPEALAWQPQSTVGLTINKGLVRIHQSLRWCQPLLQVHDSLVVQIPTARMGEAYKVQDALTVVLPYADPLIIPVGCKASSRSWGEAVDTVLERPKLVAIS